MKRLFIHIILSGCLLFLIPNKFIAAGDDWANINGNVVYNGQPVCAMALINGQYAFTCSGDGSFSLDAPLDGNGQFLVQVFCSSRAPFREKIDPSQASGLSIELSNPDSDKEPTVSATMQAINTTRCRISGTVTSEGAPLCTMVLANGKYMFTCSGNGSFDLEVTLDNDGGVTFYTFCSGMQPYKHSYKNDEISFSNDSDGDYYSINSGDCNDLDATIHPNAIEICGDGIDQDCDGVDPACVTDPKDIDDDSDGYTENQGDCNDASASVSPGAVELCNGVDDNCDGHTDEGCSGNCIKVSEGIWVFEWAYRGLVMVGFTDGFLNQNGCYLSYDFDSFFAGPLSGNYWQGENIKEQFKFQGTFSGNPATTFTGTVSEIDDSGSDIEIEMTGYKVN